MKRDCHACPPASRRAGAVGWFLPSMLLVLMPKCPACFAAYVALASGIGLSLPVAAFARTTMIGVCVAALAFLIGRRILRWIGHISRWKSSALRLQFARARRNFIASSRTIR